MLSEQFPVCDTLQLLSAVLATGENSVKVAKLKVVQLFPLKHTVRLFLVSPSGVSFTGILCLHVCVLALARAVSAASDPLHPHLLPPPCQLHAAQHGTAGSGGDFPPLRPSGPPVAGGHTRSAEQ